MPSPAQKSSMNTSRMGIASKFTVGGMRKKSMTMTTAMSEMAKFTSVKSTFSSGKIIFDTRTFLMSGADSRMEPMADDVESAMSEKSTLPRMRYMGKFCTSSPNLSTFVNTAASTHIMSRGFRTDQRTPRTLRRYLSLKSFDTSDVMVNQFRLSVALVDAV